MKDRRVLFLVTVWLAASVGYHSRVVSAQSTVAVVLQLTGIAGFFPILGELVGAARKVVDLRSQSVS